MKKHYIRYFLYSIISGAFTAIAFSVKTLWFVNFFSLIPLFLLMWKEKNSNRQIVQTMFCFGVSYYVILIYWLFVLAPVFPVNLKMAQAFIGLGILLISIINSILLTIPIYFFPYIKQDNPWDIVIFSFLYILGEWMQETLLPIAFPWGKLSVAVTPFLPFVQSASLLGSYFISFLVLIVNGILAFLLYKWKDLRKWNMEKKDSFLLFLLSILLFINTVGGAIRISFFKEEQMKREILLVQGNHSGLAKWNITPEKILKDYIHLTKSNITKETKIVVWPETAIPVYLQEQIEMKKTILKLCKENNIILILGAFKKEGKNEYNTLFKVDKDGIEKEAYYKQILVPFGEYLPFEKTFTFLFPQLVSSVKGQLNITKGTKSKNFNTPYGSVGGIICYESIFSSIAGNAVKEGADILAVASNDSWFADSPALYEHHAHAIMRGIEYNRYVIRASNTAITSVIHPTGEIIGTASPFQKTTLKAKVGFIKKDTLYSKVQNVIILPGIFLCIIAIIKRLKIKIW